MGCEAGVYIWMVDTRIYCTLSVYSYFSLSLVMVSLRASGLVSGSPVLYLVLETTVERVSSNAPRR